MRRPLRLAAAVALLGACVAGPAKAAAPTPRQSIVEIQVSGPLAAATLDRQGFDIVQSSGQTLRILLPDAAARERLAQAGYRGSVVVKDAAAAVRRSLAADARAGRATRSRLPSGRDSYRLPSDYAAELAQLAEQHPGLVRRLDLPRRSVQNRPIQGVEIASGVGSPSDGRPSYLVIGLHHAREWPSGEVALEFARDLVAGYGTDPRITSLLDRVRVLVFPLTNPDGFVISRGEAPLGIGTNVNQRKNAAGVDLNRNYGAFWGGNGASTQPSSDTYRGPGPWSEPESAAIHELTQRLNVTNVQSLHNIAALVLRPPGFKALGLAPDEERLRALGDRMAAAAGFASEYGYELYEVTGATEDWNYVAQNAFGYTIELGPAGATLFQGPYATHVVDQYLGPDGERDDGDGVREALLLAGEQAADVRDHSVLAGTAPAGATLRLRKAFQTTTSALCLAPYNGGNAECGMRGGARLLDDGLDLALTVPPSGAFTWHVPPSTRPFERKAGRTEAWTLTCLDPASGAVLAENRVVVGLGERRELTPCTPAPGGGDVVPAPRTPGSPGVPSSPGPRQGPPPPALRLSVASDVRRQRVSTVLRRGVLVRVTASGPASLHASLRRSSKRGAGIVGLHTPVRLAAGRRVAFRVRLTPTARRDARRGTLRRVVLRLDGRGGDGVQRVQALGVQLVAR